DKRGGTGALRFARLMAGRSATGVVGCLVGALGCAAVWSGCVVAFGTQLSVWGWLGTVFAGVITASILSGLLWSGRDRRWLRAVLIPEADRAGIRLGWLLAVLEGSGSSTGGQDELASLRQVAPAIGPSLLPQARRLTKPGSLPAAKPDWPVWVTPTPAAPLCAVRWCGLFVSW